MKKIKVNAGYLSNELVKAIAMIYKDGFRESDVISFSEIDKEMPGRVKLVINDTAFFISEEIVRNIADKNYDDDFFSPPENSGNCDAEFC